MTRFSFERLSKDIIGLWVDDDGELFNFIITDDEFDSLMISISELVESEPSRKSPFVETA